MRRWLSDEKNANILVNAFAFGVTFAFVFRFFKEEHMLVRWLLTCYAVVTLTLIGQYLAKMMRNPKDQSCPPDIAK